MNNTANTPSREQKETANILADFVMTIWNRVSLSIASRLNKWNISIPQFFLLSRLMHDGSLTMKDIAEIMGHSTAAATGLVDKLEGGGYAKRIHATNDRRKIFVQITTEWTAFVTKMKAEIQEEIKKITANTDDGQAEIIHTTQDALQWLKFDKS